LVIQGAAVLKLKKALHDYWKGKKNFFSFVLTSLMGLGRKEHLAVEKTLSESLRDFHLKY
jgi:hypothetical protein